MKMSGHNWKGWGISQIGPSHIKNNTPNQDSYIVKKYNWGIVGIVCDGLGSKEYSHIGSNALTKAILKASRIFDFDNKDIKLFEPLVKSLWDIEIYPYMQNECSTTLLFAIIKNKKVFVGRVGDGAIAILGDKNILVEENKDSFTNYTTPFGRDEKIEWNIFDENKVSSIVLCSDGISEDIQKNKILDFFKGYISNYRYMNIFKRTNGIKMWLKNWPVKGHSDDKTIVALVKDTNE
jgi:serine/threonine protein phosphatase PrpC